VLLIGLCGPAPAGAPATAASTTLDEFLAIANGLRAGDNQYFGQGPMLEIERALETAEFPPEERFVLLMRLTGLKLQQGDPAGGARLIDEAIALIEQPAQRSPEGSKLREALAVAHRARAVAQLRLAEAANCVEHHTDESCLFPITGSGVHINRDPSQRALLSLNYYLTANGEDLAARWLFNILAMTLGQHPDGVPEKWRIDPHRHEAKVGVPRFTDRAPQLGINTFNLAGGVVVDDFDADGWLDIVTSTSDPFGSLTYYRNTGKGGFAERTAAAGLNDQLGGLNLIGADYDNDGDVDLLVLRGAWQFDDGEVRNSLLRNNGKGVFEDVTRAAGMGRAPMPTQAATWGDYDNDGDLDLYVANEASTSHKLDFPSQLFRNNGDGTFTDIASSAGVANNRYAKGVTAGDYDNDGDLDIYVSNIGANRLYRNRGNGTFEDVAPQLGLTEPEGRSFAPWFFDQDNDGDLDLFVGAYGASVADIARDYMGLTPQSASSAFYRNKGDGSFVEAAAAVGLDRPWLPMGANFGDLDNDGFLDIYLGTGDPNFETLVPNVMLRNVAGKRFDDVTISGGFGHLQKGHGIGFADLDHDGDQDIYHQLGGFYPDDRFGNALFVNPGGGGKQLIVELRGVESNRLGVGARIEIGLVTPRGPRRIHRAVGSVSSFGGSPTSRTEIGLGDATAISEVIIRWPRSGKRVRYTNVPLGGRVRFTENKKMPERLELPQSSTKRTPAR